MPAEHIKIAVEFYDVDRQPRNRLATIEQQLRTHLVRQRCCALCIKHRTQHVGDMRKGNEDMRLSQHCLRSIQINSTVCRQRANIDFISGKLPGHDIAVMLQLAEQHARGLSL